MEGVDDSEFYPLEQVRRTLEALPHVRELGLSFVELVRGACTVRLENSPRLAGNPETGTVHGGVITTLLDSAAAAAAFSRIRQGQTVATLDLRIDYLSAADPGNAIYGWAEAYRVTRSIVFVRGHAYCHANKPLAQCAASFIVGSVGFSLA